MTATLPTSVQAAVQSPRFTWMAATGGFLVAAITASSDDGVVLCPFRRCTGGYCPGCGLTRSAGKLVRGDLVGSWHHHPALVIGLAQLLAISAAWSSGSGRVRAVIQRWRTPLLFANLSFLVALWALRLALGDVPAPFGLGG